MADPLKELIDRPEVAVFNADRGLSGWAEKLVSNERNHVLVFGESNVRRRTTMNNRTSWVEMMALELQEFTGLSDGGPGLWTLNEDVEWSINSNAQRIERFISQFDIMPVGSGMFGINAQFTWTKPQTVGTITHWEALGVDTSGYQIVETPNGPQALGSGNSGFQRSVDGGEWADVSIPWQMPSTPRIASEVRAEPITQTLRIRFANPLATAVTCGAAFYNGTQGLVVHNLARSGASTAHATGREMQRVAPIFDHYKPVLTVIQFGAVEMMAMATIEPFYPKGMKQMPLGEFEARLRAMVSKAREYGDVLLLSPTQHNEVSLWFGGVSSSFHRREDYERVMRQVAYDFDAAHINLRAVLGGQWNRMVERGLVYDDLHLNDKGMGMVARVVTEALTRNY